MFVTLCYSITLSKEKTDNCDVPAPGSKNYFRTQKRYSIFIIVSNERKKKSLIFFGVLILKKTWHGIKQDIKSDFIISNRHISRFHLCPQVHLVFCNSCTELLFQGAQPTIQR